MLSMVRKLLGLKRLLTLVCSMPRRRGITVELGKRMTFIRQFNALTLLSALMINQAFILRAKLKTAALKTQLWLTRGERKWHEEAISDTVEVLDDVRKYYPSERLIFLSALNYLGIPWKRFKKFDQAFFYQNQVVNALKDKKAKDLAS